jgi:hypothetical protein
MNDTPISKTEPLICRCGGTRQELSRLPRPFIMKLFFFDSL